jgi:glycosyltransferase involved in cell wall biosynthesis
MMEAMAAGLPVVATAVGGVPELVRHRETGLLVSPGDVDSLAGAVAELLAAPAWAAALGARARDDALECWPQHETAMRIGELLAAVASQARCVPRSAPSALAPRMRLAARSPDMPHDP